MDDDERKAKLQELGEAVREPMKDLVIFVKTNFPMVEREHAKAAIVTTLMEALREKSTTEDEILERLQKRLRAHLS